MDFSPEALASSPHHTYALAAWVLEHFYWTPQWGVQGLPSFERWMASRFHREALENLVLVGELPQEVEVKVSQAYELLEAHGDLPVICE